MMWHLFVDLKASIHSFTHSTAHSTTLSTTRSRCQVNYPPFIFEADLYDAIDDPNSSAAVGKGWYEICGRYHDYVH
jgi:hypothetical protein